MIREFNYRGERFRIVAHGHPGKEEIFLTHMEDGDEGEGLSLDRLTDAGNDPAESLETCLARLADQTMEEWNITPSDPGRGFAWDETSMEVAPRAAVRATSGQSG